MSGYQLAVLDPSAGKHGWINFLTSSLGWIPLRQPYVKPKLPSSPLCKRAQSWHGPGAVSRLAGQECCPIALAVRGEGAVPSSPGPRGERGIPAMRGLSANVSVCHGPGSEAIAGWHVPAQGRLRGGLVPSFMARMDFLGSTPTVSPVLLPVCCHPPDGSRGQMCEEQLCGLQFAAGSSQPGEGGTGQLLSPGRIPGVFLEEAGCGERRWPTRPLRCAGNRTRAPPVALGSCSKLVPLRDEPF